jgi:hypothetical protein
VATVDDDFAQVLELFVELEDGAGEVAGSLGLIGCDLLLRHPVRDEGQALRRIVGGLRELDLAEREAGGEHREKAVGV